MSAYKHVACEIGDCAACPEIRRIESNGGVLIRYVCDCNCHGFYRD